MTQPHIYIAESESPGGSEFLAALVSHDIELDRRFLAGPLTTASAEGLGPGTKVLSVFVGSRVTADVLAVCPDLELIATRSTGFDHIDMAECARRNITVVNVPTYGENTVAEHTFALILALSRNVHKAWVRTQAGDFSLSGLIGFDLRGRTLGVVGTGRIGMHVISIGRAFGMTVLASDPKPQPIVSEVLNFEYTELDDLVERSDIITLHAPLVPATHHLFDRARLQRCRPGALLINTARGGLVDTDALIWALDEGILRGAGLDVLEAEHVMEEDMRMLMDAGDPDQLRAFVQYRMLLDRENVVVTPHMAFDSVEAVQRIAEVTAANIATFLVGDAVNAVPSR